MAMSAAEDVRIEQPTYGIHLKPFEELSPHAPLRSARSNCSVNRNVRLQLGFAAEYQQPALGKCAALMPLCTSVHSMANRSDGAAGSALQCICTGTVNVGLERTVLAK